MLPQATFWRGKPHLDAPARRAAQRRSEHARRERVAGVYREPYNRWDIMERDEWRCQMPICLYPGEILSLVSRAPLSATSPTLDHIVPISKGGPDVADNVRAAHLGCNSSGRTKQ
jgi:5-methylcytosine-specific restriction endonuclease McrA